MNTSFCFTPKEFFQQVLHFRELMGDRTFMVDKKHQHQAAIDGLAFTYANLEMDTPAEDVARCGNVLDATLTEFSRRQSYLIMRPRK